jgi:hypothetical protein
MYLPWATRCSTLPTRCLRIIAQAAANEMQAAFIHLGLSEVAAHKFIINGIIDMNKLRVLSADSSDKLITQIHRDNIGDGLFILFMLQQYINAIYFWANRIYLLGAPFEANLVDEDLAEQWNDVMKEEAKVAKASNDLVKSPEPFKKEMK